MGMFLSRFLANMVKAIKVLFVLACIEFSNGITSYRLRQKFRPLQCSPRAGFEKKVQPCYDFFTKALIGPKDCNSRKNVHCCMYNCACIMKGAGFSSPVIPRKYVLPWRKKKSVATKGMKLSEGCVPGKKPPTTTPTTTTTTMANTTKASAVNLRTKQDKENTNSVGKDVSNDHGGQTPREKTEASNFTIELNSSVPTNLSDIQTTTSKPVDVQATMKAVKTTVPKSTTKKPTKSTRRTTTSPRTPQPVRITTTGSPRRPTPARTVKRTTPRLFTRPTPTPILRKNPRPKRGPTMKPAVRTTRRPVRRPTRRPPVRTTRRPVRRPTRRPLVRTTRRPVRRATRKPPVRTTRRPVRRPPTRRAPVRTTRRPVRRPTRRPLVRTTRRPVRRPTRRPPVRTTRRPVRRQTRRPTVRPTQRPVRTTRKPSRTTKKPCRTTARPSFGFSFFSRFSSILNGFGMDATVVGNDGC